ncbi:MAG: hypothetical protein PF489_00600 [Salinivirgaceae bacterium]|jgi:DNA-binding transcriptional regulator GbsR (MarR family)|nr:hypothetical protein [Salinivirgaceae bacterium]
MNTEERIKKQLELIETMGRIFEREGMQPVVGRIMALLMVMDKEMFTFDQIVEELQISKSSASVGLKILQASNSIEYTTIPGDRKRYFRIKSQDPLSLMEDIKRKIEEKRGILTQVLELKADPESRNSQFFKNLIYIMNHFLEKYEKHKEKYQNKG